MSNVRAILYYIHVNTNNQINKKIPYVPSLLHVRYIHKNTNTAINTKILNIHYFLDIRSIHKYTHTQLNNKSPHATSIFPYSIFMRLQIIKSIIKPARSFAFVCMCQTLLPIRFSNICAILHTQIFSRQSIYKGIRFRTSCTPH